MTATETTVNDIKHQHIGKLIGVASSVHGKQTVVVGMLIAYEHYLDDRDVKSRVTVQISKDLQLDMTANWGATIYLGDSADQIVEHLAALSAERDED